MEHYQKFEGIRQNGTASSRGSERRLPSVMEYVERFHESLPPIFLR
jgi:hypothetical protein